MFMLVAIEYSLVPKLGEKQRVISKYMGSTIIGVSCLGFMGNMHRLKITAGQKVWVKGTKSRGSPTRSVRKCTS